MPKNFLYMLPVFAFLLPPATRIIALKNKELNSLRYLAPHLFNYQLAKANNQKTCKQFLRGRKASQRCLTALISSPDSSLASNIFKVKSRCPSRVISASTL